jgi:PAP2 superfamily
MASLSVIDRVSNVTFANPGARLRGSWFLTLFCSALWSVAQTPSPAPFTLDTKRELTHFVLPGLVLHASSFLVKIPADDLWNRYGHVDRATLPAFDRQAAYNWDLDAHHASNVLLIAGMGTSLAYCMLNQQGKERIMPLVLCSESAFLTSGLTDLAKNLIHRPRPYVYNPDLPEEFRRKEEAYVSFWSGHTANTAAITFTCANILQRSDVSKTTKTIGWISAAVIPAAVGFFRVKAGRHFPTDVIVGYTIGAAVGWAIPFMHRSELVHLR